MTPQKQLRPDDCLITCACMILDLDRKEQENMIVKPGTDFKMAFGAWFYELGYTFVYFEFQLARGSLPIWGPPSVYLILGGISPTGIRHAVVGNFCHEDGDVGLQILADPHPLNCGIDVPDCIYLIQPLNMSGKMRINPELLHH